MFRKLFSVGLLSLVSSSLGCAVCCSPDDCNYAAYGGRWQRHDMASGRVGSAFAEAGFDALGEAGGIDAVIEPPRAPSVEPMPRPGDDYIRPVSHNEVSADDEVSSYIE